MDELFQALAQLGNPIYWVAVVAAVFGAAITGLIPGASSVVILALAIPIVVQKIEDPAIGLVALATVTGVNNTLDSIPSILIGQPGAATQVTFLEGHQLARQGKAAHTLGAVYAVSAMGGIIGAIVLAMLIPVIKPVILQFGFAEIAAMGLFGIAMVSVLSQGAMIKGLIAGLLGLLLGTVGVNPVTGDARFVFDRTELWGGLPLIATSLGLFAIPEMIDLTMTRRPVAPPDAKIDSSEVIRGARDGLKSWKMVIRQSIFGVIFGAIPGVGAAVIDWLAYAVGIFFTKDKTEFGKGSLQGVLFAESAQNSKEAGQAIPTLALGVPGGLAWALVLVAMLAYNISPGPPLLGDRADITILLVITLAIGNLLVTMLGLVATGTLAKLTRIPYPIIGGVVIPVSFLTGLISMSNWFFLPIMLVMAGIGIIMKIYGWPRPPLLLGVILGRIIELNFQSALSIYDGIGGVLTRPITIILICIAIATSVFLSRTRGLGGGADSVQHGSASVKPSIKDAILDHRNLPILLLIGGAAAFLQETRSFNNSDSALVPVITSVGILLLASLQFVNNLRNRGQSGGQVMDLGMHSLALPGARFAAIAFFLLLFGFVILTGIIGLRLGAIAFAASVPLVFMTGPTRVPMAVISALLVFVFQRLLMDYVLNVIWPGAHLIGWFGEHLF